MNRVRMREENEENGKFKMENGKWKMENIMLRNEY